MYMHKEELLALNEFISQSFDGSNETGLMNSLTCEVDFLLLMNSYPKVRVVLLRRA